MLLTAVHKALIFWLVLINHNFETSKFQNRHCAVIWFLPFHRLFVILSLFIWWQKKKKERKLNLLLSSFNWQLSSHNINVQGEHFGLGEHLYQLFPSLEFITRLFWWVLGGCHQSSPILCQQQVIACSKCGETQHCYTEGLKGQVAKQNSLFLD